MAPKFHAQPLTLLINKLPQLCSMQLERQRVKTLNKLQSYFSGVPITSLPAIDQQTTCFYTHQAAVTRPAV